jgi:hypothetical protein
MRATVTKAVDADLDRSGRWVRLRDEKLFRDTERAIRAWRHRLGPLSPGDALVVVAWIARRIYCTTYRRGDRRPSFEAVLDQAWTWCVTDLPEASLLVVRAGVLAAMRMRSRDDNAENAGKALRLTYEDRRRLKITTIWACDVDPADRQRLYRERKRERDAARARAKRAEKGAKTRTENLSKTRPWEAEGITRRTWERRRAAKATPSAAMTIPPVTQFVAHPESDPLRTMPTPRLVPCRNSSPDTLKEEATNKGRTLGGGIRTGVCVRARPGLPAGIRDIDRERRERKARWLEQAAAPVVPPAPPANLVANCPDVGPCAPARPASTPRPPDEREQLRRGLVAEGCSPEDVVRELREHDERWWASMFDDAADARGAA